jgi:REP element-mobilizing transposase RayT
MKYDAKIHHRRSIRLNHYDYSLPGAYFVTICTFGKLCIFGQVVGDQMRENDCGRIVREQWLDTVRIRPQVELDAFTVMPNHLHGILWILGPKGEHIPGNTGYVIPDAVGPNSIRPVVGPNSIRPVVGPKSLRPNVGPNGVGPGPNAVRPYNKGAVQSPIGPANPIPPMRPRSLASWASGFKSAVTSRIRKLWNDPDAVVWQEDYFERIIRDEKELLNVRDYILSNPLRWKLDRENPEAGPDAKDDPPWNHEDESEL